VELDGFSERDDIIMIAAPNLLEKLDPAPLRPGGSTARSSSRRPI
jgi:ATP-dependent 26S proteasome regulatory subunit